jgi:hypothetical protein
MTQPYDSGMAVDRPARSKPALHIAACLRVVAKHKNMPSISVDGARDVIKRLALYGDTDAELKSDVLLREHLHRATGMPLAELAALTDLWP